MNLPPTMRFPRLGFWLFHSLLVPVVFGGGVALGMFHATGHGSGHAHPSSAQAPAAPTGEAAGAIREEMFTFDDIAKLDKKSMQKILAAVDSRQLAVSLKAAIPAVEQSILGNLSKRAADMVREERDSLGPTPLSDVVASQNEILKMIRDMMDKGDIKAGGAAEQLV